LIVSIFGGELQPDVEKFHGIGETAQNIGFQCDFFAIEQVENGVLVFDFVPNEKRFVTSGENAVIVAEIKCILDHESLLQAYSFCLP
jgi:hypothetical protein